ncbi:MAG: RDD family protein [bacterium]
MDPPGLRTASSVEVAAHSDAASSLAVETPLATLGQRIIAQFVDGFVAFGVFLFMGITLAPRFGAATASGFELTGTPARLMMTIVGVLLLGYFTVAEAAFGATLGKTAAGIRVRRVGGAPIGLLGALLRNLLRIVDAQGFYLVAVVSIIVTKHRQRLGDLAAKSVVVQSPAAGWARLAAVIVALALAAGAVVAGYRMRGPSGPLAGLQQFTPLTLQPLAAPAVHGPLQL